MVWNWWRGYPPGISPQVHHTPAARQKCDAQLALAFWLKFCIHTYIYVDDSGGWSECLGFAGNVALPLNGPTVNILICLVPKRIYLRA